MSLSNGVMMQCFHWYLPADGSLWRQVASQAGDLAQAGISALWLPPATKGIGGTNDVGYGVYDLYDLGEFDQKGAVRTKYGTRAEYLAAVKAVQSAGMQVYADTVFNHRMGADTTELVRATPYPSDDRLRPKGAPRDIRAYTSFRFPGRRSKHSRFEWNASHFDAVDFDDLRRDERDTVYLFDGKSFDDQVALENGNYAYLMGADVDFQNPAVQEELVAWGKWFLDTTGVDGFRLDAVKHISAWFFPRWIDELERHAGRDLFFVGEYWSPDIFALERYVDAMNGRMNVFGVALHYRFEEAGRLGSHFDMRRLFDSTLVRTRSRDVVTFVDNHDSQPMQALESTVAPWFKPLAYAAILLRQEGYPCIFHPDYYGATYEDRGQTITMPSHRFLIDRFLHARRHYAWGPQIDYLDHWNRVGWVRLGDGEHPKAMAVLMSDGPEGTKWMNVQRPNAAFVDLTEHLREPVVTNATGWGEFGVNGGSVSVWIEQ